MTKIRKKYSDEDKLHFVRLYQSGMSKKLLFAVGMRYVSILLLNAWLKKVCTQSKRSIFVFRNRFNRYMANRSKEESFKDENAQLKKRIKELESIGLFLKLETEARDLMITRAEEYFNIPY